MEGGRQWPNKYIIHEMAASVLKKSVVRWRGGNAVAKGRGAGCATSAPYCRTWGAEPYILLVQKQPGTEAWGGVLGRWKANKHKVAGTEWAKGSVEWHKVCSHRAPWALLRTWDLMWGEDTGRLWGRSVWLCLKSITQCSCTADLGNRKGENKKDWFWGLCNCPGKRGRWSKTI